MGDPLEFINIYSVANYQKMKGDSLIQRKKFEKSLIVEKTSKLKTLSFSGYGRRFYFGGGSDVSSMFWTCVVQVAQMNKKVDDHTRKKCPLYESDTFPENC